MTNSNDLWLKIKLMIYGDTRFQKDSSGMTGELNNGALSKISGKYFVKEISLNFNQKLNLQCV